jgi:D-alanine-D-alanine ligase
MKRKIAIAAGGDSGEYEISIQSASIVEAYLDNDLYDSFLIVFKGNEWNHTDAANKVHQVNKDDFSIKIRDQHIIFDAVFIIIHGTPGEDGKLQGYLDMLNIPYTSCNQTTSALTFNKYFCNLVVSSQGFKVSSSCILYKDGETNYNEIIGITSLPCFVKPNCGGSSVGMSKVHLAEELPLAVQKAFREDDEVLVEGFVSGREITCGVFSDHGRVRSLPLTEVISKNDFFDYEAKYTDGLAQEITPALVPDTIEKECRSISEQLYKLLNCQGVVRFDYIFNDSGIYFLEVNTVPGLSPSSIVPKQSLEEGIPLKELFNIILDQALNK